MLYSPVEAEWYGISLTQIKHIPLKGRDSSWKQSVQYFVLASLSKTVLPKKVSGAALIDLIVMTHSPYKRVSPTSHGF